MELNPGLIMVPCAAYLLMHTFSEKNQQHGYLNSHDQKTAYVLSINNMVFQEKHEIQVPASIPHAISKKCCLIVGGSGGIGSVWVDVAIKQGYQVICVSRDVSKYTSVDKEKVFSISCDLSKYSDIIGFCRIVSGVTFEKVIIASGIKMGKDISFSESLHEMTFSVNYFGPVLLLETLIKNKNVSCKTKDVIFLSSCLHDPDCAYKEENWFLGDLKNLFNCASISYSPNISYYKSKFALECYRHYLQGHLPKAYVLSINPKEKKLAESEGISPENYLCYYSEIFINDKKRQDYIDLQKDKILRPFETNRLLDFLKHNNYLPTYNDFHCLNGSDKKNNIKICTINIFGIVSQAEKTHLQNRLQYMLNYFLYNKVDYVCLQEISPLAWDTLYQFTSKHNFHLSPDLLSKEFLPDDYVTTAIISRWQPDQSFTTALPFSEVNKNYHVSFVKIAHLWLGSCHLINGIENDEKRFIQMRFISEEIEKRLRPNEDFVLCGDFNQDLDSSKGKHLIDVLKVSQQDSLIDVWHSLYPNRDGFTVDVNNTMRKRMKHNTVSRRVDGMIIKNNNFLSPVFTEIVFNKKIFMLNDLAFYPSDHYGLYFALSYIVD